MICPYSLIALYALFLFKYDHEVTWDTAVHRKAPGNCPVVRVIFFPFFPNFNRKLLEDVMQICLRVEPPCMYHLNLIKNAPQ
jgi:hypothetical protein